MAVAEGLARFGGVRFHEAGIAVGQIHRQEMRFLLDTADDDQRLAEVGLGVTRRMRQRNKHLARTQRLFLDIIFHDGIATGEAVFVA